MTDVDVQEIIDYESGILDYDATVGLFQRLVDSGLAWQLQGHYGRTAADLIKSGDVVRTPERIPVLSDADWAGRICDHCHTAINSDTHRWVEAVPERSYLIVNCSREDSTK